MLERPLPRRWGYAFAIASVAFAFLLRLALQPLLGGSYPYITFFIAILATAYACTLGCSLLALALSSFAVALFLLPPIDSFDLLDAASALGLLLFLALGSLAIALAESERRSRSRLAIEVAQRVRDEERLREGEDRLRQLIDTLPQIAWFALPDGSIDRFNSRWHDYTGRSSEQSVGDAWRSAVHPDDLHLLEDRRFAALGSGAPFEAEVRVARRDGVYRWHLIRSDPIRDTAGRVLGRFGTAIDIDDRRRLEEELRAGEARTRLALEAGRLGTWEWDIPSGRVEWSENLEQIHGLRPGSFSGTLEAFHSLIHPDDRPRVVEAVHRSIEHQIPYEIEFRNLRADGSFGWISGRGVVLVDPTPKAQRMIGVAQDITESRRLAEQLEAERDRLEAFFSATPVGLGIVDSHFRYLQVNEALAETNGTSADDHLGRTVAEIIPQLWPTLEPLFRHVLQTGEPIRNLSVEGETNKSAGRRQSWIANYFPLRLGASVVGVGFNVVETTEARLRKARLAETEERLRLAVEATGLGIWDTSPNLSVISWSEDLKAIYGLRPGEPIHIDRVLRMIHPEDLDRVLAAHKDAVNPASNGLIDIEHRIIRADGATRWISVSGRCAFSEVDGRRVPDRLVGTAHDITDRKTYEQERRDADRRKDEFLAMLAHELRNPLAPIRNAITLLAEADHDPQTRRWAREVIDRQVAHMTHLVDDLLDVGRITQGKITLARESVTISRLIAAAIESSRPSIDARAQHLELSLPDIDLNLDGDPTRLAQVLLNLLNNASKFTPEGGRIHLSAHHEAGFAVIRVRDNGEGIPAELLPHVFDLFTQASQATDRAEGGLGIGLTLVRRLVEMHGGTVEAQSPGPGLGSDFIVRLPARSHAPAPPLDPDSPDSEPGPTLRVLVVDDNIDSADSLCRLLRILGHVAEPAHDGQSALDAAQLRPPDLVLLDLGLPAMDGYEVARRLRAQTSFPGLHIVALTGYGSQSDRDRSLAAGFDDHLVKPVDPKRLFALLASTSPSLTKSH